MGAEKTASQIQSRNREGAEERKRLHSEISREKSGHAYTYVEAILELARPSNERASEREKERGQWCKMIT